MESKPLKDLQEIDNWSPDVELLSEQKFSITRSKKYLNGKEWIDNAKNWEWLVKTPLKLVDDKKPRTLLCHDMMGGYINDRFVQPVPNKDSYSFLHWNCLDVFVYFSHNFITIPPTGWIAAAKMHGVKILGTVITEWKEGKKLLEELLSDEKRIDSFVDQLADIASFYGFQGWLLNIENPVEWTLVPYLLQLVEKLNKKIHEIYGSEGLVIWYDSVTIEGKLQWQDEVNMLNRPFMDNCDGIFLNYNWRTPDSDPPRYSLENSVVTVGEGRKADIYVGVDVFGRGCIGGGGLNTNVAMHKIHERSLSAAIFAPGWTYESSLENDVLSKDYFFKEHLFWSKLEPYLTFHALKLDYNSQHKEGNRQARLIFESKFETGRRKDSFHLLSMQTQPSLLNINTNMYKNSEEHVGESEVVTSDQTQYCCHTTDPKDKDALPGLQLSVEKENVTIPIFLMEISPEGTDLIFVLSSKSENITDTDLVLGTDKGEELLTDKIEDLLMDQFLPDLDQNDLKTQGFVVQNCYDTIEKIGLRLNKRLSHDFLTFMSQFLDCFCIFSLT